MAPFGRYWLKFYRQPIEYFAFSHFLICLNKLYLLNTLLSFYSYYSIPVKSGSCICHFVAV